VEVAGVALRRRRGGEGRVGTRHEVVDEGVGSAVVDVAGAAGAGVAGSRPVGLVEILRVEVLVVGEGADADPAAAGLDVGGDGRVVVVAVGPPARAHHGGQGGRVAGLGLDARQQEAGKVVVAGGVGAGTVFGHGELAVARRVVRLDPGVE